MKRQLIFLCIVSLLSFGSTTNAQTTAADWTLTDCGGTDHTLYTYLDSEEVVIMVFGMGCFSCAEAGDYLVSIRDQFEITNPGKVNLFYMDYWAGNFCATEVIPITDTIAFDAGFAHCDPQKSYYMSGTPMPGIVIAGGSFHNVLYEMNYFMPGDTTTISNVITNFFNTIGIKEINNTSNTAVIFPNPTNGNATIQLDWNQNDNVNITVFDMIGNEVMNSNNYSLVKGTQEIKLQLANLYEGNYFIRIQSETQLVSLPITIKL